MNTALQVEKQLTDIVQQFLAESGSEYTHRKISLDASLQRHLGIDSLGRAELFQRIEKSFGVQLANNLIVEAESLQDVADAIIAAAPLEKIKLQPVNKPVHEKIHIDPTHANSLLELLSLYAKNDPDRPHIYMQDESGIEELMTYGQLYETSQTVAHSLLHLGLQPGETVAIMQPTQLGFFSTFFGILMAGGVPVPIYPPLRPQQIESYAKQEAKILRNAEVRILVTFHEAENLSYLLRAFIPSLKEITTVNDLLKMKVDKEPVSYSAKPDDYALIQYTSGSTSAPKGVLLTHQNLLANIRSYGEAIQLTTDDVVVSWLPLYHDLGLIGMWLGSLYHGVPLILLSPLTFLNRPERWLWAIHYHRATISAGPNFAYELCVRKIDPEIIEGLDLSTLRLTANGAEAVQPKTLQAFAKKFAPYGFKAEAMQPVYGLAESCVGLTCPPINRPVRIDQIQRSAFESSRLALVAMETDKNALEFVSCGHPLPRHEIRIVDEAMQALPERHIGRLQFKGPSSMQGYYGNPEATRAIHYDGWLDTGDLAYIADNELFITGRKKDVIIKAGRNLHPAEIEELASRVIGIRQGCVIAFGVSDAQRGTEKLVVVAETRELKPKNRESLIEQITDSINSSLDVAPDHVILIPPRHIPKTSSGKLQRSACKAAYLDGTLLKSRLPAWAQIIKLGAQWLGLKIRDGLCFSGKILYTAYTGLMIGITMIPVFICLFILPQDVNARICKVWTRLISLLAFCPLTVEGKEYLDASKPMVYAANHSSFIDAVLLKSVLPYDIRFVGKKELLDSPIVGTFMRRLGHVFVDRKDFPKGFEDTQEIVDILKAGHPIVIFPEGTFRYAEGLRPFKLGTFKVAAETNTPVCPIGIQGARHILRGTQLILKPGRIKITICEPIQPKGTDWQALTQLRADVRAEIAKHCGETSLDLIISTLPNEIVS